MKKFIMNFLICCAVMFSMTNLVSCDNSLDGYNKTENVTEQIQIVRTPDIVAWSGEQVLGSTFGINSASSVYLSISAEPTVERYQSDRNWLNVPELISEAESNYVIKYLADHPNEGYDVFDCDTYYIQVVGGSYDEYTTEPDQNGATQTVKGTEKMNYLVINGTFTWYNNNDRNSEDIIKISNVPAQNCSYTDSFDGGSTRTTYKFYYITLPNEEQYGNLAGKTQLYLCFDYMTLSQNGVVNPDGKYNDWVIKLTPADGSEITVPQTTDTENPEDSIPETSYDYDMTNSEVEVNLSIKSEGYDDFIGLVSKLSIHVRHAGDVEVFIPVPAGKYCEVDDMYIFEEHWVENFAYGGNITENVITYYIGENVVTLTISFEETGIRVTTNGINEDVFAHCVEHHQDGINFEIFNYFNELVGFDELQEYLNQATVRFADNNYPDYYINGFYKNDDNTGANDRDCTVSIVEEQSSTYEKAASEGWHLNESKWNWIYKKQSVENNNEGFVHDHDFLYKNNLDE